MISYKYFCGTLPVSIVPDKIICAFSDHSYNDSGIVPLIMLLDTSNRSKIFNHDVPNDVDNVPEIRLLSIVKLVKLGVYVTSTCGIVSDIAFPDIIKICNVG
jgi:hypothetical protein